MKMYIFQLLIWYFHIIPNKIFKVFWTNKKNSLIFSNLSGIDEWQLTYKAHNLIQFFIPLISDISTLYSQILKSFKTKKLISIVTVLIIYEETNNTMYTHSLFESNKLYNLNNFKDWPINLFSNLVEKLELYNSFKKISLIIKVKEITAI